MQYYFACEERDGVSLNDRNMIMFSDIVLKVCPLNIFCRYEYDN